MHSRPNDILITYLRK